MKALMNIIMLFTLFVSAQGFSQQAEQDNVIDMVAGLPKPPFIVEENGKGLQLDLIREALAAESYDIKFVHMPLGRNITGYQRVNADGIITLLPDYEHPALYMSKPYITYQNVAISLAENQFKIGKIDDLSTKTIMAFQNAKKFLGEEYNRTVNYSMDYREVHDQKKQIDMLFLRRAEVIIMDLSIFKWFLKNNPTDIYNKPFNVHYIFNERQYSAGFRTELLRDKFDEGIQQMKENGNYQLIMDNYLN